ncbi:MAG: hypothetical protein AAGE52_01470 [Myxococcota bacterium]
MADRPQLHHLTEACSCFACETARRDAESIRQTTLEDALGENAWDALSPHTPADRIEQELELFGYTKEEQVAFARKMDAKVKRLLGVREAKLRMREIIERDGEDAVAERMRRALFSEEE